MGIGSRTLIRVIATCSFGFFVTLVTAVYAQGATQFKLDTRAESAQNRIVVTAQNPPTGYNTIIVRRDETGFNPVKCSGGAATPQADGYVFEAGVQYCDTNVAKENTYHYWARAVQASLPDVQIGPVTQAYQVTGDTTTSGYKYLFGTRDLNGFISNMVNWVAFRIGPSLVAMMIIYAGFEYITSNGDEAKTKTAKDRIYGSILGFIVLMLIGTIMRGFFL